MDKTIGCILIVLVLTLVPIFPMANATTLGLHDLVAGGIETATITCQANERVSGSFNISSASAIDDSIIFSIRDPLEKTILNSGTVVGGENFTLTTDYNGTYTLIFDNSASSFPKYLQLEYTVSSPSVPEMTPLTLPIAAIIVSSVFIMVKRKKKASKSNK